MIVAIAAVGSELVLALYCVDCSVRSKAGIILIAVRDVLCGQDSWSDVIRGGKLAKAA